MNVEIKQQNKKQKAEKNNNNKKKTSKQTNKTKQTNNDRTDTVHPGRFVRYRPTALNMTMPGTVGLSSLEQAL